MSQRPISPSPVRPSPQRVFSPPPRFRSPPPLQPAPRIISPTFATSPPPLSRDTARDTSKDGVVSPPPILNIQPSTPVRPSSPDSTNSAPVTLTSTPAEPAAKLPGSKSLDAIHEVLETGEGSDPESGQKISSNSSSLILPPTSPQRKPAPGAAVGQLQPLEGQRSMTVEVTSKPTAQLAPTEKDKATAKLEAGLKSVKSNDTMKPPIQPKPPKKKRSRAANIANTSISPLSTRLTVDSSKAEIFAAKVAAVVDANPDSSDSDEAFVYDSGNPPPTNQNASTKPRSGMHSRTPSMTSINSAYTAGNATYGTVPAGRGRASGSNDEGYNFPTITRGQTRSFQNKPNDENRRRSILPDDSPFTLHVQNPTFNTISPQPSRNSLHPGRSPRGKQTLPKGGGTVKTPKWAQSQFYDGDDDDSYATHEHNERVPLLPRDINRSTKRFKGYKSRNRALSGKQAAQIQNNYERRRSGRFQHSPQESRCWPGLAGTAILVFTLLVLTMITVGFVFQTSRSLENVTLTNITNIVVSEQELVMDLLLEAGNPNILPVVAGDHLAIDVFARSDHFQDPDQPKTKRIGKKRAIPFWPPSWDNDSGREKKEELNPKPKVTPNVTEGTSLLLGTIMSLEAPLTFPSTTFKKIPYTTQKGQMKLVAPAVNATDGHEKWKKCIMFPFELILRGTMKYRAPIGGRERAVALEWRGTVDPLLNKVWNGQEWKE